MTASNLPRFSNAPSNPAASDAFSSRWVQFNRALAASAAVTLRPGLQGRWKPSDRVVIATSA